MNDKDAERVLAQIVEPNPFTQRAASEQAGTPALEAPAPALAGILGPPEPAAPETKAEIAIVDGQMQLTTIDQVWRVARLIRQSGLAPDAFKNDQQIVVVLLRAMELKVPIFQALEGMIVIKGKIGIMGDLALALVEASGELESKKVEYSGEGESLSCTVTLKRRKRAAQAYSFSIAEAKLAGLANKETWRTYPKRLLYYRALGYGLRDDFSHVLKWIKCLEELQDYSENFAK